MPNATPYHVYTHMVRSVMCYVAPAWLHAAPTHIRQLRKVQNLAFRALTVHDRVTRIAQLYEDSEDLPLSYLRIVFVR